MARILTTTIKQFLNLYQMILAHKMHSAVADAIHSAVKSKIAKMFHV